MNKRWLAWTGVAVLAGALSLTYSWRTYNLSQYKGEEAQIAEMDVSAGDWKTYNVSFNQTGNLVVYYWNLNGLPNDHTSMLRMWTKTKLDKTDFSLTSGKKVAKKYPVKPTDPVRHFAMWNYKPHWVLAGQPVGFKPVNNNKCGTVDVKSQLDKARENNQTIARAMCWEANPDWFGGNQTDYSDYLLVLAVQTATASASPRPSPSPSSSPRPNAASFRVLNFNDKNANAKKDEDEGATGLRWRYKYRTAKGSEWGDWQTDYYTNAKSSFGPSVTVPKGSQVEVVQYGKSGWKATTDATQKLTLSEAKLYTLTFGNHKLAASPSPGASPSPSPSASPATGGGEYPPPKQPETGTPTWITLSLLAGGLGISLMKIINFLKNVKKI